MVVSHVGFTTPPSLLITHNTTHVDSNAFIDGTIPSAYPTKANTTRSVSWIAVRIACQGHIINNKCAALIKMDSSAEEPIILGWVEMDMLTGLITPDTISNNGFNLHATQAGEIVLSEEPS